jgi:hypothetical protein
LALGTAIGVLGIQASRAERSTVGE